MYLFSGIALSSLSLSARIVSTNFHIGFDGMNIMKLCDLRPNCVQLWLTWLLITANCMQQSGKNLHVDLIAVDD